MLVVFVAILIVVDKLFGYSMEKSFWAYCIQGLFFVSAPLLFDVAEKHGWDKSDFSCLVVHRFDDGEGFQPVALPADYLSSVLKPFLDADADAGDLGSCLAD